ncbi:hypothetical protein J6590_094307 [Homalodisca vitripennis]|nr:hypothetical protein J6590_094307 [Homalodisca vitripennis]
MKPSPSGSGGKKEAYYLENAMQFCLPFIKTVTPPFPGNLPPPPSNTQSTVPENEGSETQLDDPIQLEIDPTDVDHVSPEMSPSILDHPQQAVEIQSTSSTSSNRPTSQIPKTKSKSAATIADQTVAEYFRVKKAKLLSKLEADTNQNIGRQQGIKMFLLSLIPELEVIDDISLSGHHQQQPRSSSGLTILTSPTMSDSRESQIDLTHMSDAELTSLQGAAPSGSQGSSGLLAPIDVIEFSIALWRSATRLVLQVVSPCSARRRGWPEGQRQCYHSTSPTFTRYSEL